MYCLICHKQKPDNHYDLYPDHAVSKKRPLYMGEDSEAGEASPPSAARTPRAPRVPAGAAPYDTSEGGGVGGLVILGIIGLGVIGAVVYRWWTGRGEGGGEPGAAPPQ